MKFIVALIWTIIFLGFICWVFSGCNPSKKAHQFADSHPKEFAGFCADQFPVKDSVYTMDSVHFDTLYKEGEPQIDITYLTDTVFKTVYFPGTTQFITKTVRRDSIIIRRDSAAVQAKQNQINDLIINNKDLIGQRDRFKDKFNWWRLACIITWSAIIVLIAGRIVIGKFNLLTMFK